MYLKKGFELESWRANHTKQWSPENIFQELKRFAKTIEDYPPSRTPLPPFFNYLTGLFLTVTIFSLIG